ncbi:hypothetical protein F5884DRAFT_748663 [Xylogone sp. PMI_703]|nr:hypothetical protein F5884DRAFT_748663 [Xylogone sp. PMI_703]
MPRCQLLGLLGCSSGQLGQPAGALGKQSLGHILGFGYTYGGILTGIQPSDCIEEGTRRRSHQGFPRVATEKGLGPVNPRAEKVVCSVVAADKRAPSPATSHSFPRSLKQQALLQGTKSRGPEITRVFDSS